MTRLTVVRGLPGAIQYHQRGEQFPAHEILSPWHVVNWSMRTIGNNEIELITAVDWKLAHSTIRDRVERLCWEGKNVVAWFEYDKFYHLTDFCAIAETKKRDFCVFDVFDNGLTNYELIENAQLFTPYKNCITNKYLNAKRSKWHHKWQRQK